MHTALTITRKCYSDTLLVFSSQLEADLATGVRGGRKAKLIAKSWIAINPNQCATSERNYLYFREKWMNRTIYDINQFLKGLPQQTNPEP